MKRKEFSYDAKKYAQEVLRIHHLFAAGQENSDEANETREKMKYYEDSMPAGDWLYLKGLSGDLYMMSNEGLYEETDAESQALQRKRLFDAILTEDWETVLYVLRHAIELPRVVIAHYRARAYAPFPEVSLIFQGIADEELMKIYGT